MKNPAQIPDDVRYSKSHEWARRNADGTVTIGITYYAQNSLGDITYAGLPKVGKALNAVDEFGVVESVKAASDLYAPIAGSVTEVNNALEANPELVNSSPYEDGWIIKMRPSNPGAFDQLMSADEYAKFTNTTR